MRSIFLKNIRKKASGFNLAIIAIGIFIFAFVLNSSTVGKQKIETVKVVKVINKSRIAHERVGDSSSVLDDNIQVLCLDKRGNHFLVIVPRTRHISVGSLIKIGIKKRLLYGQDIEYVLFK